MVAVGKSCLMSGGKSIDFGGGGKSNEWPMWLCSGRGQVK